MLDVSIDLGLVGVGTVIASEQKKKKDVREQFKRSEAPDPWREGQ